MNTTELLFEEERLNARAIIDGSLLKDFITINCYEEIGKNRDGKSKTLMEELKTLGGWHNKIQAIKISNYQKSKKAYSFVEYTDEERKDIAYHTYELSANKILWLNSICHSLLGEYFVKIKINKSQAKDVCDLVDGFAFCINHPEYI